METGKTSMMTIFGGWRRDFCTLAMSLHFCLAVQNARGGYLSWDCYFDLPLILFCLTQQNRKTNSEGVMLGGSFALWQCLCTFASQSIMLVVVSPFMGDIEAIVCGAAAHCEWEEYSSHSHIALYLLLLLLRLQLILHTGPNFSFTRLAGTLEISLVVILMLLRRISLVEC